MKIICTADVHVNPKYPERLARFGYILEEAAKTDGRCVIVAGDLIDSGIHGYHDLQELLKRYSGDAGVNVYAVRGNHDVRLRRGDIAAGDNFKFYEEPEIVPIGGRDFLFVPYVSGTNLFDEVKGSGLVVPPGAIIISHGDVTGSGRLGRGQGETDAYFPMAPLDLDRLKAGRAILGHIHAPQVLAGSRIHYTGSPYPLDPSEVGLRQYLVLSAGADEQDDQVESVAIGLGPVYLPLVISVVPNDHEIEQVRGTVTTALEAFKRELPVGALSGELVLRPVRLKGFTKTRREQVIGEAAKVIEEVARSTGCTVRCDGELDDSDLKIAVDDLVLADLLETLIVEIKKLPQSLLLPPPDRRPGPTREEVREAVLTLLYGRDQ